MFTATVPVYTTSLIGRTRETAEVMALLNTPTVQLVTLTGASGTGKTRLATEVALAFAEQKRSTIFVPLSAISDPQLVLPELARYLDIREQSALSLLEQLINYFQGSELMVILDNFEQVAVAATQLEQLIQAVPTLQVLVTSQTALGLDCETVYVIPGLHTPQTIPETPQAALKYAAVQLFVERIQAVQPAWSLTLDQVEAVVEICRLVEGLPLAIEIVAAHSDVLLPGDLVILVRQHLTLYTYRAQQASGRERILLPIIEWSLSRLEPDVQQVFNHLGVFRGGWNRAALSEVMGPHEYDLADALDVLVERHLVLVYQITETEVRYMLLDAVQAFAEGRFKKVTFRYDVRLRLIAFLGRFIHERNQQLVFGDAHAYAMARLHDELPNIRAMLQWSLDHHSSAAGKLGLYLGRFWHLSGYWREGVHWAKAILTQAEPSDEEKAGMYSYLAMLLESLGSYDAAAEVMQTGIPIARRINFHLATATMLQSLGLIYLNQHQIDQARACFEECLEIAKTSANKVMETLQYCCLAEVARAEQDYMQALALAQQAVQVAEPVPFDFGVCAAYLIIADVQVLQGHSQQALLDVERALTIAERLDLAEQRGVGYTVKAQALLLIEAAEAATVLATALHTLHEIGANRFLIATLETAATWFVLQNNSQLAGMCLGAVDTLRRSLHMPRRITDPVYALLETRLDSVEAAVRASGRDQALDKVIKIALQALS